MGPALGDKGDVARFWAHQAFVGLEEGIEAVVPVEAADAVWTDHTDTISTGFLLDFPFQGGQFPAQFLAASGDDQHGRYLEFPALFEKVRNQGKPHNHHQKIHFFGDIPQRFITFKTENFLSSPGHWKDFSLVVMVDQAVGHHITDFSGGAGCTDERYLLRFKKLVQMGD